MESLAGDQQGFSVIIFGPVLPLLSPFVKALLFPLKIQYLERINLHIDQHEKSCPPFPLYAFCYPFGASMPAH